MTDLEVDANGAGLSSLAEKLAVLARQMPEPTTTLDPREENYQQKFSQLEEAWNEWQRTVERTAALATREGTGTRHWLPELFINNLGGELVAPVMNCSADTSIGSVVDHVERQVEMYENELYDVLLEYECASKKEKRRKDDLLRWSGGVFANDRWDEGSNCSIYSGGFAWPLGSLRIGWKLACLHNSGDRPETFNDDSTVADFIGQTLNDDRTVAQIYFEDDKEDEVRLCYDRKRQLIKQAGWNKAVWQLSLPEPHSSDLMYDLERGCVCPLSFFVNRLVCPNARGPFVELVKGVNQKYGEALVGLASSRVVERTDHGGGMYFQRDWDDDRTSPVVKSTLNLVCTEASAGSVAEPLGRDMRVMDLVTDVQMSFQAVWVHPAEVY